MPVARQNVFKKTRAVHSRSMTVYSIIRILEEVGIDDNGSRSAGFIHCDERRSGRDDHVPGDRACGKGGLRDLLHRFRPDTAQSKDRLGGRCHPVVRDQKRDARLVSGRKHPEVNILFQVPYSPGMKVSAQRSGDLFRNAGDPANGIPTECKDCQRRACHLAER